MESVQHFINGKTVAGTSGRQGDVYNPATGEIARKVDFASEEDVNKAVAAAQEALPGWAATPPLTRARIMMKYRELLEDNADDLA
ncbi:MAG: aldehyde dehydrogenase family protein, partial [Pseudomonadota bacterium]